MSDANTENTDPDLMKDLDDDQLEDLEETLAEDEA